MKKLNTILMTLGILAGTTAMQAQTRAQAHIPFDFTVSATAMPAGDYSLRCTTSVCNVLQLVNDETRKSVIVLVRDNSESTNHPKASAVTFHRYENSYYFSGMRTEGGWARRAEPSARERELTASTHDKMLAEISIPLTALR